MRPDIARKLAKKRGTKRERDVAMRMFAPADADRRFGQPHYGHPDEGQPVKVVDQNGRQLDLFTSRNSEPTGDDDG